MGSNPTLSADFYGFPDKDDAAHDAPFTSRSTSADGAQVGTGESLCPPLTKLEQDTLVQALEDWGDCDAFNIDSRRVRTRVLNSLQAKGLIYSLGMDGRRPLTNAGFDAAKALRGAA